MPKIQLIKAHKILNSRGEWTVDTEVTLDNGFSVQQTVPEGASKGEHEAVYLPVEKSMEIINHPINDALEGEDPTNQAKIDSIMINMDGTENKAHLGGNSILSVSLAVARLAAQIKNIELFEYLSSLIGTNVKKGKNLVFPTPIFNVLNGGKHTHNNLSFQEFIIIPAAYLDFVKKMEIGVTVYQDLKHDLLEAGFGADVGDEGGFAPDHFTTDTVLRTVSKAVSRHYKIGKDVFLGMDVAAESFVDHKKYKIREEDLSLDTKEFADFYEALIAKYPLIYVEDPFYEKDLEGWDIFYKKFSGKLLVVGDDLTVTNAKYLKKAIDKKLVNAVIVKPNQVGTLTETLQFIQTARQNKLGIIISHRSGDSGEDTFIADLALATKAEFLKAGAPVRGERVVKYNRLLDIYSEINN